MSRTHICWNPPHLLVTALFGFGASFVVADQSAVAQEADDFPNRPITLVVPFPPSGPPDLLARSISEHLSKAWGQPVVVENRPGANGIVATQFTATAEADGYTLMVGSVATHAMNRALRQMRFDTLESFVPVTQLGYTPLLVTAHPSLGVKSIAELAEAAKEAPDTITYASVGQGSAAHLTAELFDAVAGVTMVHIPYEGIAQASLDLVSGEVQVGFSNVVNMLPYVQNGQVEALAVTSAERMPTLPDIPTVAETYPGFDVELWWGIFAPTGTPDAIVEKLSAEINVMLKNPELVERWAKSATTIVGSTPAEFGTLVRADADRWQQVIQQGGIKQ